MRLAPASNTHPSPPSPCPPTPKHPPPAGFEKAFFFFLFCHSTFPLGDFCLPERFETSHIFPYK